MILLDKTYANAMIRITACFLLSVGMLGSGTYKTLYLYKKTNVYSVIEKYTNIIQNYVFDLG